LNNREQVGCAPPRRGHCGFPQCSPNRRRRGAAHRRVGRPTWVDRSTMLVEAAVGGRLLLHRRDPANGPADRQHLLRCPPARCALNRRLLQSPLAVLKPSPTAPIAPLTPPSPDDASASLPPVPASGSSPHRRGDTD